MARVIRHGRSGSDDPVLMFNYRSDRNEIWDDDDLMEVQQYSVVYPVRIVCYPESEPDQGDREMHALSVLDPEGLYRSPELECPGDLIDITTFDFPSGPGDPRDPIEIARERLKGLEPGDAIEGGGYPLAEHRTIREVPCFRHGPSRMSVNLTFDEYPQRPCSFSRSLSWCWFGDPGATGRLGTWLGGL